MFHFLSVFSFCFVPFNEVFRAVFLPRDTERRKGGVNDVVKSTHGEIQWENVCFLQTLLKFPSQSALLPHKKQTFPSCWKQMAQLFVCFFKVVQIFSVFSLFSDLDLHNHSPVFLRCRMAGMDVGSIPGLERLRGVCLFPWVCLRSFQGLLRCSSHRPTTCMCPPPQPPPSPETLSAGGSRSRRWMDG